MKFQKRMLIPALALVLFSACAGSQTVGGSGQSAAVQAGPAQMVTQLKMDLASARSKKELNYGYERQIASLENQITGLKGFSRQQESAKEKLAAERRFNELFDTVQGYFTPDEAEVYKQGKQLYIRMRGIKFPVGKSTLTPDNFSLMSKVQKAIQTFGLPVVAVEGHTDSTGSADVNQRLSKERAEAVKAYLVANQTLPLDHISASGYGPSRPLASNSTPEGRAVNRRIDVLITPSQTP